MGEYHISARSDPQDIRECSSCELKEIADWLHASYEEDDTKTRIVINKDKNKIVSFVVLRVLPNTLNVFVARPGAASDIPITLQDVNRFIFQKLTIAGVGVKEQGEIRQVVIFNAWGAQLIIDDSGGLAFSSLPAKRQINKNIDSNPIT